MRRVEAEALALEIMAEHGLLEAGWVFRFNGRRRALGATVWRRGGEGWRPLAVELSGPLVDINDAATVEDTVRHEVAHALAGNEAGHGSGWRAACRVTGAVPERLCGSGVSVPFRWAGVCPSCGEVRVRRDRVTARARGFRCAPCVDGAVTLASVPPVEWRRAEEVVAV